MKQLIQSFLDLTSIYQNYVTSVFVKGLVYVLLLLAATLPSRVWGQCNPVNDRANLIALYNATGGSSWTTKTNWNTGAPISTWYGITTNASGCVTNISLLNNNLVGSLPSALGSLNNMEGLTISFNEGLTGSIPISIGNLSQLQYLDFAANNLTGTIPTSIGNLSNLRVLILEQNAQLTGSLPSSLGNITGLEEIWIGADDLTGQIPSTLGNLSNLTTLVLVGNNLSGCIPATLQNLCPHVTFGLIGGNPNLATQDWDNFCNFQEGMCAACNPYTSDISSDVTICQGESADLTFNFSAGTPPYTVTWTGGTLTNIQDGDVVTVMPTTTKTYKVTVATDAAGCTSTTGTSATVKVLTTSSITLGAITGSVNVCQNTTTTYSVSPLANATSYSWSVPVGATIQSGQGTNSISVKWTGTSSGNICVFATNQCGDGPETCKAVTVNPSPVVNLGSSSTCGTTVLLNAANPGSTYLWNTGATTQTLSVSTSGTYTVTVTKSGCSATGSATVVIQPAIQVSNITATNLTGSFTLTGGKPQVNGSNYASVTMALQGNPAVTATLTTAPFTHNETVSFTCPQAGMYMVVATDAGGCSGTGTVVVGSGGGGPTPCIEWQNTIGGSKYDILFSVKQTTDGGYILAGESTSDASGDKTENHIGLWDQWIVKLNSSGNIVWQNTIGGSGSGTNKVYDVEQTTDGGYILAGMSTAGIGGDKTEDNLGEWDCWVIKLNSSGSIVWQNTIGGSKADELFSVEQTPDGGYILGATSSSDIGGDKTENSQGSNDYWVVKLNSSGNIVWQNTIGGSGNDILYDIGKTSDGGYILAGLSTSNISGDKNENSLGSSDYWVVKLNSTGAITWQNTIGGIGYEDLQSIQQTSDGGYILGGDSDSGISGDKTEASQGSSRLVAVKIKQTSNFRAKSENGGFFISQE